MPDHVENRMDLLRSLHEELVGPAPLGKEIDCTGEVHFEDPTQAYGPFRQKGNREEILNRDSPTKRYGVGVLFPPATGLDQEDAGDSEPSEIHDEVDLVSDISEELVEQLAAISDRKRNPPNDDTSDLDLTTTNAFRPSTMGISFLCHLPVGSNLEVTATGGRYIKKTIQVGTQEKIWWLREPVQIVAEFHVADLKANPFSKVPGKPVVKNTGGMNIDVELYCRPRDKDEQYLVTLCLVNREGKSNTSPEACLFQAHFSAEVQKGITGGEILPYPGPEVVSRHDDEIESLDLLYRKTQTFAVGHGCAADWKSDSETGQVKNVTAENLPTFETPSMTPDVERDNRSRVEVSMAELAGLSEESDGFDSLEEVIELYGTWIERRNLEVESLEKRYDRAARRHIIDCEKALMRMKDGLEFLRSDPKSMRAFKLANEAILIQQARSIPDLRKLSFDHTRLRIEFSGEYPQIDLLNTPGRGKWRAFQIAFLLMSLRSAADPSSPDRDTVELIWFPTGGGKTEAYLGLAAFSLFLRRLTNPNDSGVHILMRYTLRLLTAQQFQRASGLICAMESIRRRNTDDMGDDEISIGIWLGSSTTPNTKTVAVKNLKDLQSGKKWDVENKFILTRCPWCSAQLGPIKYKGRTPKNAPRVAGYWEAGTSVRFRCVDQSCDFRQGLPVFVVDEDIYEEKPSLVIGTADKFAMLAWKPQARSLFGIEPDGSRGASPPGLIIQDELHLISGPLGSMYGLYEAAIDELCTDRRDGGAAGPKIVCSTATIRRYEDQIKALFGRNSVCLFPPPGLEDGDSFFAKYARDEEDRLCQGRMYVGVHAPALGSMQTTQIRTFSALLQAPVKFEPRERDPWWSLMLFFNSLRELGTTLTLFQSDIPDYFSAIRNRTGADHDELRNVGFLNVRELTGRLRDDEVPKAIEDLEVEVKENNKTFPVDVCLASSIIEVGIDIDRLSLMCIVGQPKTTSQYIQVSGRVGRRWWERPGLVVTLYGASKPRDRSHFEKFRTYHERLYAQVEPTSVTPFSPPVLDRALHAALVLYVRQTGGRNVTDSPYPFPEQLINRFRSILEERVKLVDEEESENLTIQFSKRIREWKKWQRTLWESERQTQDTPLIRYAGEYVAPGDAKISWATPTSLRNVDAECQTEITQLYIKEDDNDA